MDLTAVLPVTYNARGLGGLATEHGTVTAPVLFRADALSGLTAVGVAGLAELGIGTIVDLRTDHEQARSTDALPQDGSLEIIALPVLGGAMDEIARNLMPADGSAPTAAQVSAVLSSIPTIEELYLSILASSSGQFAALARAVVEASTSGRPGVLFHCTAGKDRTGLAAALLLTVAGVPREAVVADYALTERKLEGTFARALLALVEATGVPMTPALETLATKSPEQAIVAALDWVEIQHGDAAGYLRSGGLTEPELRRLRESLVVAG